MKSCGNYVTRRQDGDEENETTKNFLTRTSSYLREREREEKKQRVREGKHSDC
jgi:hypothetical protein